MSFCPSPEPCYILQTGADSSRPLTAPPCPLPLFTYTQESVERTGRGLSAAQLALRLADR